MGRKFYLHSGAEMRDGEWFCSYCGQKLPKDEKGLPITQTDWPCTVSLPVPFDSQVQVSVWDMVARVMVDGEFVDYRQLPKRQAGKLQRLAEESVYDVGGALNWSGIYPPSEKLCEYVQWLRRRGYI